MLTFPKIPPTIRLNREPYGVVIHDVDLNVVGVTDPLSGYLLNLIIKYGINSAVDMVGSLIGEEEAVNLAYRIISSMPNLSLHVGKYTRNYYSIYYQKISDEVLLSHDIKLEDLIRANLGFRSSSIPEKIYIWNLDGPKASDVNFFLYPTIDDKKLLPNHVIILEARRIYFIEDVLKFLPDWTFREVRISKIPDSEDEFLNLKGLLDKVSIEVNHSYLIKNADRIQNLIDALNEHGIRTELTYIPSAHLEDFRVIGRFLAKTDILRFKPFSMMYGPSWSMTPSVQSLRSLKEFLEKKTGEAQRIGPYVIYEDYQIIDMRHLNRALGGHSGNTVPRRYPYRCMAYRTIMAVLPNGDVVGCPWMLFVSRKSLEVLKMGNILRDHFDRIWGERVEYLAFPRRTYFVNSECYNCDYFPVCSRYFGFCYVWNDFLTGNPFSRDRFCKRDDYS